MSQRKCPKYPLKLRMSPLQYSGMSAYVWLCASRVPKALLVITISYVLYIKLILEISTEMLNFKNENHHHILTVLPNFLKYKAKKKQSKTFQKKRFCLYQLCPLLNSQFGFPVRNREKKSAMLIRNIILSLHSVHIKRYPHTHRSPVSPVGKRKQRNEISSLD